MVLEKKRDLRFLKSARSFGIYGFFRKGVLDVAAKTLRESRKAGFYQYKKTCSPWSFNKPKNKLMFASFFYFLFIPLFRKVSIKIGVERGYIMAEKSGDLA